MSRQSKEYQRTKKAKDTYIEHQECQDIFNIREGFGEARFSKLKVPELQITFSFATLWHLDVPGNRRM
jgi:hypothetical protein